jgi:RNA polymerase sigma-70 factor (sigma-E family)
MTAEALSPSREPVASVYGEGDAVELTHRQAFEALVESRYRALTRSAYLLTGDWSLAEDLVQTALAKTWFRWGSLRDVGAGEAYVRSVMVHVYTHWWRRRWRGEVPTSELPESSGGDDYAALDERDRLRRALATLPRKQRAMIVLRFFEDMTESQVADVLGCSLGTVKSGSARALARLRQLDVITESTRAEVELPAAGGHS